MVLNQEEKLFKTLHGPKKLLIKEIFFFTRTNHQGKIFFIGMNHIYQERFESNSSSFSDFNLLFIKIAPLKIFHLKTPQWKALPPKLKVCYSKVTVRRRSMVKVATCRLKIPIRRSSNV